MNKLVYQIKSQAAQLIEDTDEQLTQKIEKFRKSILLNYQNRSKFTSVFSSSELIKWFSLVQEVSFRTIGLRHFDTQLLAGLILNEGKIVEMKTGEGKTLVSTLPVSLNALTNKGAHVVTVNDYLAERDQKWMGKVYNALGLSVGLVKSTSTLKQKQQSYRSDITYITNSELVFDYLRDSSSYHFNEIVQRRFNFCLIDEIDSILIDEARTPLIISVSTPSENNDKLYLSKVLVTLLEKDIHFQLDEKKKDVNLTEQGYVEAKEKLGVETLFDPHDPWALSILNALKAQYLFKLNKDYIVLNNKIVIVDEFTGRIMEDRRWSMGLHEAVEMKESLNVGGGTKTKTSITYQNFFPLYPKLSGMTGTAKTTEKEFQDIYNLKVVVLPTVKPMIRKDLSDLVYQTELAKWKAVLNQSRTCFETGQPILIGTSTIEKSEFLSNLFKYSNIPHQVLNAKPENVSRESEIVAQAGERYAVTIATNMAGRGTDIILGGNPIFKTKQQIWELLIEEKFISEHLSLPLDVLRLATQVSTDYSREPDLLKLQIKDLPYSFDECSSTLQSLYTFLYEAQKEKWVSDNKIVKNLGGLFVLGTERHETRRIDNQLRGRSGRQGDPGISQFFVSLEDDLIKVFGGDSIRRWVGFLLQDKDVPLESNVLTKSLENAQKKIELYNYDLRKNVFQYDDILNTHRKQLFRIRSEILLENTYDTLFLRCHEYFFNEECDRISKYYNSDFLFFFLNSRSRLDCLFGSSFCNSFSFNEIFQSIEFQNLSGNPSQKQSKAFLKIITKKKYSNSKILEEFKKQAYSNLWVLNDLQYAQTNLYQVGLFKSTKSLHTLSIIDHSWTEHIERMNYIRETINWRSYGQQNPLIEYNIQAVKSFKLLFEQIRSSMLYSFLEDSANYL